MPQPVPGSAPTLPARPDPEAELLKALGRRDASTCLRLVQHLVHRRGVAAIETLQRHAPTPDSESLDWAWLGQLLAAEPMAAAPRSALAQAGPAPLEQVAAVPIGATTALTAALKADAAAAAEAPAGFSPLHVQPELSVLSESEPALGVAMAGGVATELDLAPEHDPAAEQAQAVCDSEPAAPKPLLGRPELNQRAEAAVDAAFEALAAEFPDYGRPPVIVPAPTRALDSSLEAAEPPMDLEEPPAELFRDPLLFPPLGNRPRTRFSFVIPQPLQPQASGSEPAGTTDQDQPWGNPASTGTDPEPALQAEPADAAAAAASLWRRAEGRMASLRERVRGRLSLTGVKTLVRDCVEEAVSSLQGPAPLGEPRSQDNTAPQSEGRLAAAPSDPWSLEQPLPQPQGSSARSGHQAPIAAFGPPLGGDSIPPLSNLAAAPARLSTAQHLRQRLLGRPQPESRPAPAPQALSDLRAWLAADDDLPRAS
ncbi:MAG: hypothetical protein WCQ20_00920 [Synechococcaceae cyanobacterium ELA739]